MTKKILRLRRFCGSGQDDSEHSFVILSEVQSKDLFSFLHKPLLQFLKPIVGDQRILLQAL